MTFTVPLVDISAYVSPESTAEERVTVARALDDACREVGFIQVTGHGVPDDVLAGLASAMDDFFGLDLDAKLAARAPAGANRGYTAPKSESLSLSLGVESATG